MLTCTWDLTGLDITLEAPEKVRLNLMVSAEIGPETNIYPQLATQLVSAIAPAKLNPRVVRKNMTYPRASSCSILGS